MPVAERTRVLITGIGAVTTIGTGREALWEGAMRGESAVLCLTRFDASGFRSRIAAQIDDFDPLTYMDKRRENRLDRFAQFSLAASLLAVEDAQLTINPRLSERTAIYVGSALGGIGFAETQHERFLRDGIRAVNPALALSVFGGASSPTIPIHLSIPRHIQTASIPPVRCATPLPPRILRRSRLTTSMPTRAAHRSTMPRRRNPSAMSSAHMPTVFQSPVQRE